MYHCGFPGNIDGSECILIQNVGLNLTYSLIHVYICNKVFNNCKKRMLRKSRGDWHFFFAPGGARGLLGEGLEEIC